MVINVIIRTYKLANTNIFNMIFYYQASQMKILRAPDTISKPSRLDARARVMFPGWDQTYKRFKPRDGIIAPGHGSTAPGVEPLASVPCGVA